MRVLILDTYYEAFQRAFYARHPALSAQPYSAQWRALQDQCFGTADFYSANLAPLGVEAHEFIVNCDQLQLQWAREYAPVLAAAYPLFARPGRARKLWQLGVLQAQLGWYRPDVLYVQDLTWAPAALLRWARGRVRLVAGQTAYPLPRRLDLRPYDLLVSSFPHYVRRFREAGRDSEYLRIAFEPRVLARLGPPAAAHDAVFVGSFSAAHRDGVQLLEQVSRQVPLSCWGYGVEQLAPDSPIHARYHGEAWGLAMYAVLAGARVALNRHINVAENFANNMRLYEATGVGACLVTDRKDNLGELFELDREVVAYTSAADCAEKVRYLLDHEEERAAIAAAGQRRTLREHTYARRMQELAPLLERRLHAPAGGRSRTMIITRTRQLLNRVRPGGAVSYGHRPIDPAEATALTGAWQDESIPAQQRRLADGQLRLMYAGERVPVFEVAARAIRATGLSRPRVVELGCASAYYSEALPHLLGQPIRYVGLDYSLALLRQARRHYADLPLASADAAALPLADGSCEIAFSSGLLPCVLDYGRAISETVRVSRSWCVFHRTPVVQRAPTTTLGKYAYGVPVFELVFNEGEIRALLAEADLEVVQVFELEGYPLPELGEEVAMKTFVCRKRGDEQ